MRERELARQAWPMMVGLAAFPLSAAAIGVATLVVARPDPVLLAGAVFLLVAGQVATIVVLVARVQRIESEAEMAAVSRAGISDRLEKAEARLVQAEQRSGNVTREGIDSLLAEVQSLRDVVGAFVSANHEAERRDSPRTSPGPSSASAIRWAAGDQAPGRGKAGAERLGLLLEPVIELATGNTAHYRALLDLAGSGGQVVAHDELVSKADLGGMRPALDAHLVRQVVPVLRRLRNRHPALGVFVRIGRSTLQSAETLQQVEGLLQSGQDVVRGLVFEISQRDLGQLDDAGLAGIARLARLGATLALADVQVAGLDLAALRQLGVRYLSFPPAAADAGFGPSPAWREFVQYARAMQFQIILSGIESSRQAEAAERIGRFAYGPFYAPPRRVRADAGAREATRHQAAA